MNRVKVFNLSDNFIEELASHIVENFSNENLDFSSLTCIFPNKRPAHYLNDALHKKLGRSFFPPKIMMMDEFTEELLRQQKNFTGIPHLEACYIIYKSIKKIDPSLLVGKQNFKDFIPWAEEIYSFINQLDIEDIDSKSLTDVEKSAQIGYEIPQNILAILKNITQIRESLHEAMENMKMFSRSYVYLSLSKILHELDYGSFGNILFSAFFYLQKTEKKIIKHTHKFKNAYLYFQGSQREFKILFDLAKDLSIEIVPKKEEDKRTPQIKIYSAFDEIGEALASKEILGTINNNEKTAVVLGDEKSALSILPFIYDDSNRIDLSIDYPLKRSTIYLLLKSIFNAQLTRLADKYYVKEYLDVVRHPIISSHTVGKIVKILKGQILSNLNGSAFIKLEDISGIFGAPDKKAIEEINKIYFKEWENIGTIFEFIKAFNKLSEIIQETDFIKNNTLESAFFNEILNVIDEFKKCSFLGAKIGKEGIFKLFGKIIDKHSILFSSKNSNGIKIMGFYETNSLSFENVIVMGMNESILPRTKLIEPLIPKEIMFYLSLNRVENEIEIQKHQFYRLISSAKNVHLIYKDDGKLPKSRFLEEIIWKKEKEESRINALSEINAVYDVNPISNKEEIKKNEEHILHLKKMIYSASSVNTYLDCPKMFYFKYVLKLREEKDLLKKVESAEIGTYVHELLFETFKYIMGMRPELGKDFKINFLKKASSSFDSFFKERMDIDGFLLKKLLISRLEKFIDNESKREIRKIIFLEKRLNGEILSGNNRFRFTSIIDRMDLDLDGRMLIIDYKTGSSDVMPKKNIDENTFKTFDRRHIKKIIKSFQFPIYLYIAGGHFKRNELNAASYNIKTLEFTELWKKDNHSDRAKKLNICMEALKSLLEEIIDPKHSFVSDDEDQSICERCEYGEICR